MPYWGEYIHYSNKFQEQADESLPVPV